MSAVITDKAGIMKCEDYGHIDLKDKPHITL